MKSAFNPHVSRSHQIGQASPGPLLVLPVNGNGSDHTPASSENSQISNRAERPRSILIVEDNIINQKVALRILAQYGYQAETVGNGQEAIEAFERKAYDLILMDIQMPVMDGIEATKKIRNRFGTKSPYIIAVTANVTAHDRKNCMDAGMNDFVSKPINAAVLAAAIEKAPKPLADTKRDRAKSLQENTTASC